MKLDLQLYIRRHRSGFFTVSVLGDHPLELFTDDLDRAREDLELVVSDLVDRSHPRRQSAYAPAVSADAHIVEVPDLLTVQGEEDASKVSAAFTALVSGQSWQNVWLPRLDLHLFFKNKRKTWEQDVAELVEKHLKGMDQGAQLRLRLDAEEWIEIFEVEAKPPPLTKFVGKYRDIELLPLPADEVDSEVTRKADGSVRPPTPTLTQIGVNIGELARDGEIERAHERKKVVDDLYGLISGKRKQSVAVVGPPGVGKTTILNELAHRVAHEADDPKTSRPVFFVDASRLVAGQNWFGDWQRQTLDVLEECETADVIWFVGNLVSLLDAGKNICCEQNVAMLMKTALAGHRVTVVGECATTSWSQLELRDAGFARMFTLFRVEEPEDGETRRILQAILRELEKEHRLKIRPAALEATVELSKRYASSASGLGSAAHLLRRVTEAAAAGGKMTVDRDVVVRHFCTESGLPDFLVRDDLPLPADDITAAFSRRLIGQDYAVSLMTNLVTVIKAGLSDLGRPLGSFLFVGPTGVGKTETAKTLASFLFGTEHRLTRFDMSEFSGWDAVHRFLGRQDQEGKLVAAVRRRPFSVVLLDEIEKASPAIFDVLLQVLGEARLTDEAGRTADFRNVVIIMTSNLGVETLKRAMGFQSRSIEEQYREHFLAEAQKFFRPELFNRIDHIVPFMPLGAPAIRAITAREVDKFTRREGLRHRNLTLEFDDRVYEWLAERGIDERYGARPLKRVLEKRLTAPLAQRLADGTPEGTRTIVVTPDGDQLAFDVKPPKTKSSADRLRTLEAFVTRVRDLRFRHRVWCDTSTFREARQRLRLLERLSQDKRFWDDKQLADERMAGVQEDRRMVDALLEIGHRVDSLDDLAHDSYFRRDVDTLAELTSECADVTASLINEELAVHARGIDHPHGVTLFLTAGSQAERWRERIVVAYTELARSRGWKVQLNLLWLDLDEPEPEPPPPKNPTKKKKGRKRQDDDQDLAAMSPKKPSKKSIKAGELKWRRTRPELLSFEENEEDSLRRTISVALAKGDDADTVVLFIEGAHAGTMLVEEAGQHIRITDAGMQSVMLRTRPAVDRSAPKPDFLSGPLVKNRVVDERRNQIDDHLLNLHLPLEPRIWRVYERFMRARPFKRAFGPKGIDWFRAWESD